MASSYTSRSNFDQLFLSHLGALLRPKYDLLVRDCLPVKYWDLLIQFADAEASLDPAGVITAAPVSD